MENWKFKYMRFIATNSNNNRINFNNLINFSPRFDSNCLPTNSNNALNDMPVSHCNSHTINKNVFSIFSAPVCLIHVKASTCASKHGQHAKLGNVLYGNECAQKGPLPSMEPQWQRKVGLLSRASSGHKRPEP